MKLFRPSSLLLFFLILISLAAFSQELSKGNIVVNHFEAASIKGNNGGEDPMRRLTIYLPAGYDASSDRYPVIYFLHGFVITDSLTMIWNGINELMDEAIHRKLIRPMILVLPDSDTKYKGSFYTNSLFTGKWAEYISKDVVEYMDSNFRTLPAKSSRGLAGHSMGGNGALKIAMLYPNVFDAVYALSAAVLSFPKDFAKNPVFKDLASFDGNINRYDLMDGLVNGNTEAPKIFQKLLMANLSRTYSPDSHSAKLPAIYHGNKMVIQDDVVKQWELNFPMNMLDSHVKELSNLRALKMDWGRNDRDITILCNQFSKKMEALKINHYAEEYLGGHIDKIGGMDGRIYTEMLPFFDTYLKFAYK